MAANPLPNTVAGLIGLGTNMLAGLNSLGTTLGITQISPAAFQFALDDYMSCVTAFNAFRSSEQTASTAWQASLTTLGEWLEVTRGVLTGRLGRRWSPLWAQAGFANNSTALPQTSDGRLTLAYSLSLFFAGHQSYEVPGMQVTGARATTLRTAALAAEQALATVGVSKQGQWEARETAREMLVGEMRVLIKILGATIGALDPQWLAFGLQMPGTQATPGQPLNVLVGLDFTGQISVQCDAVPLAQRYRWRMRVAGGQAGYELVARSVAPQSLSRRWGRGRRCRSWCRR